jgi:hypothetical protein
MNWVALGLLTVGLAAFGLDADAAPRSSGAAAVAIMKLEGTAGGEHAAPAAGAAVPRRVSRRAISEK